MVDNRGEALLEVNPSNCTEPAVEAGSWLVDLGKQYTVGAIDLQGVGLTAQGGRPPWPSQLLAARGAPG